jgi:hypothetical protein
MKAITILNNSRFISDHGSGIICYHDSRHNLIRTRLSGGGFAGLIKELQSDGTDRALFLTVCGVGIVARAAGQAQKASDYILAGEPVANIQRGLSVRSRT